MDTLDEQVDKQERDELDQLANELHKKYETVTIMVTRTATMEDISIGREAGTTRGLVRGAGNYFARIGQAMLWVEHHRELERVEVRRDNE